MKETLLLLVVMMSFSLQLIYPYDCLVPHDHHRAHQYHRHSLLQIFVHQSIDRSLHWHLISLMHHHVSMFRPRYVIPPMLMKRDVVWHEKHVETMEKMVLVMLVRWELTELEVMVIVIA